MADRTAEIIRKIEAGEAVDCRQFADLLALDLVRQGERWADEIAELMRAHDGAHRYRRLKNIEFHESGAVKRVELYEPEA